MKKLLFLLIPILGFGQNRLTNGGFESANSGEWQNSGALLSIVITDPHSGSSRANLGNEQGTIRQDFTVTAGVEYTVSFWWMFSNATSTTDAFATIKRQSDDSNISPTPITLTKGTGVWTKETFTFTSATETALYFNVWKPNRNSVSPQSVNNAMRFDNVSITQVGTSGFIDSNTPSNAQPLGVPGSWNLDFSDEFNDATINTSKWVVSVSNKSRAPRANLGVDDWWWVENNAFLNGSGNLVLRGTKIDHNTMHCGSVESRNLYEPTYGYLEAKIKIAETAKGNHTAFWTQGHNQGNVDNSAADGAEIDIFESAWTSNTTKTVVHYDGYGAGAKNHTIPYNTPNIHNGYHTFGLHWTPTSMDIYYDGVKVSSSNVNKPLPYTTDPINGNPLVPQVPEWLWLSVGASFGDGDFQSQAVGTLSDALVDYVRVYKSATLGIQDNIIEEKFKLFPNPASNYIKIKTEDPKYNVLIYDQNGRILLSSKESKTTNINLEQFAAGLYYFKINSGQETKVYPMIVN